MLIRQLLLEASSDSRVYIGNFDDGVVRAVLTSFKQESGEHNTHTLHKLCYGERWRFPVRGRVVFWWETPSEEAKEAVSAYLEKRGLKPSMTAVLGRETGTLNLDRQTWVNAAHGRL